MIKQRKLGRQGPAVGGIGYGAMVLEGFYGDSDDSQAVDTIHRALDLGVNMVDSADARAASIELSEDVLQEIDTIAP